MSSSICVFVNGLCLCLVCIWFYYSGEGDIANGSFEVHHHGDLVVKGEHGYDFVGGEVTFFDEFKQDYICQFVIDEFGEELGLQAPYTMFFMNL